MKKPDILMFHRVRIGNTQQVNNWYFQRKMIVDIDRVFKIIDDYFVNGYLAGSIQQCIENKNHFHLSFDDGFKEHLQVAVLLKKKYNLPCNSVNFSINISNSINHDFTGMDLVYSILADNKIGKLNQFLESDFETNNIAEIKKRIANLEPEKLKQFSDCFPEFHERLKNTFLNEAEIIELSEFFRITSHGITHRFLTNHKNESEKEILLSKVVLENIINKKIDTFCYPEGKNDAELQEYCKNAGYNCALSIRHEANNNFCIGRKIV